jgi:lipoate-protein ligase B
VLCVVYQLGVMAYDQAHRLQKNLIPKILAGETPEVLLLLEHPPTITIGKSGALDNVLISSSQLAREEIALFFTDRGGDATYHGPGQIVGYPLMDLRKRNRDLHRYVHDLEEVLIRTAMDFSISAHRDQGHRGVWVGKEELAAIGLGVTKWITFHGFALNVTSNLDHFSFINPCGFSDRKATSMSRLLSSNISMEVVTERLLAHFSQIFKVELLLAPHIPDDFFL